jgi:hypothetical protein
MKKPSSQIWAVSFIGARGNDKITDLLLVNTKQLYIDFILIRWRVEIAHSCVAINRMHSRLTTLSWSNKYTLF